jgi:hypothetical protein
MAIILIFDDNEKEQQQMVDGLRRELGGRGEVIPFTPAAAPADGATLERYVSSWMDEWLAGKDIGLVVCDKELGRYGPLKGLSATPVSAVALQTGVPFCQYSRQAKEDAREFARFKRLRQWSADEITLEGLSPKEWVPQVVGLFGGFEQIRTEYKSLGDRATRTPAMALAAILGKPESESRIALYGSGEQGFLKEILTFYDPAKPDMAALFKRMPRMLGNWLFLSILRFPGILVNEVAAASYLNIAHSAFVRKDVQRHFGSAVYSGPFSELGPWWWRAELDALIGDSGCKDGREYVQRKAGVVPPCLDPQSRERAGYYCMLTQKPVSAQNSCGGVSWFPSGADLARIRKDKFEQIAALVGMY